MNLRIHIYLAFHRQVLIPARSKFENACWLGLGVYSLTLNLSNLELQSASSENNFQPTISNINPMSSENQSTGNPILVLFNWQSPFSVIQ